MTGSSGSKQVKMLVMTEDRYASCPVWRGLVRSHAAEVLAYERGAAPLARIFPHLETIWYKPEAQASDEALLKTLRHLQDHNPEIDLVLCLTEADPDRLETFFSLGLRDIMFIDEFAPEQSQALIRTLSRLRRGQHEESLLLRERSRLTQALKEKSDSIAWLCHEIRTPLNGLLGVMELYESTPLDKDQGELLDIMSRCGQNMVDLVSDVLDLSKLEASKMEVKNNNFDLLRLFQDSIALYQREADKKRLKLSYQLAPEVPSQLIGDERKLGQILHNLLSNAVKYTAKGTVKLKVRLENQDDSLLTLGFTIEDTGYGIGREQWEKVFLPYEQTDSEQLTLRPSSGLGMSLTKQLVELMGGTISFHSALGQGTTFHVTLPFHPAPRRISETKRPSATLRPLQDFEGCHVLVVDDDPINLKVAKRQLARLSSQVTVASSGLEALELIEKQNFDLIFVDCQMPHMDGTELLKIMRQQAKDLRAYTPVIALTALAQDRQLILAEGFDDYLAKPARLEDMAKLIEKWLLTPQESAQNKNPA